jgi:NTE family protein
VRAGAITNLIANPALSAVHRLACLASLSRARWAADRWHPPIRRFSSRTTILRRAIYEVLFRGARLKDLPADKPLTVSNAADLRTGSAFYFTQKDPGSWRLGRLAAADITLAQAVTASAAFPLILPALDENLPFIRKDGSSDRARHARP